MTKYVPLALIFIGLLACETKKQERSNAVKDTTSQDTRTSGEVHNLLTETQKREGWRLIFNGTDTAGWRMFKNKENNSWEVVDGTLHCKPLDNADKRADIMTVEQFENFELSFDWKISPQGNSGVMYRVTEAYDQPYLSGPEYQVIDDNSPGDLKELQKAAANYDMHAAPKDKPLNAVGEWNTSKIVVNENHIEHWLNGSKLLEYELGSEEWKKLKAASKWNDARGYGAAKKGHIDFQDHGNEVWYRNIMIKDL